MAESPSTYLKGLLMVIAATACWSFSGVLINLIVDHSPLTPIALAFWRDLVTFIALVLGLRLMRPSLLRVRHSDLKWLAAMGGCVALFHIFWNLSVTTIGVSVTTVVQSNAPIFVSVMAWLLWREPLTWHKIAAMALALAGTLLIARLDHPAAMTITPTGLIIALAGAVAYGSFSLFGKRLDGRTGAWTSLTYTFAFASLALLPFQWGAPRPWPIRPVVAGAFAALVLGVTILGFALYLSGLRRLPASIASITATTEVPFAALTSYLVLGERLDNWQMVGAGAIIFGVALVSLPRREVTLTASLHPAPPSGDCVEGER